MTTENTTQANETVRTRIYHEGHEDQAVEFKGPAKSQVEILAERLAEIRAREHAISKELQLRKDIENLQSVLKSCKAELEKIENSFREY